MGWFGKTALVHQISPIDTDFQKSEPRIHLGRSSRNQNNLTTDFADLKTKNKSH